ncbi:protease complex subunit PrcB family protein [Polyangium aurulentum]|uniref:protease complex subunit PrcB family protein n=1 Tax=Polyangium aurulentum TaxID=2567896 RepID=UPI0010AE6190|nr:protease complex subunit PrcB family protein [Polyangium aurulentum]UQA61204.1 protease complex subunit PrcB family protein [Polyangium aurulentum]
MGQFFTARWLGCMAMALASLGGAGCVDVAAEEPITDASPLVPASDERSIPFQELDVRASRRTPDERKQVITSVEDYRSLVGGAPPPEVDFRRHWVVYYGAGVRPTGGYHARIAGIERSGSGRILTITTQLVEPGPGCIVTQALTYPYVLARVPRQEGVRRILFEREDEVLTCGRMTDDLESP